jgi:citrate synthase
VPSAHCAVRSTAARTKWRWKSSRAIRNADDAEADIRARVERKEIIIGFGHPVYTVSDPRNEIIKEISRKLCTDGGNPLCSRCPSASRN